MSMGGAGPEVLVTLTTDIGKILEGLHRTKIRGTSHLATGIQVASVRSGAPVHSRNHIDQSCSSLSIIVKTNPNASAL